jgi:ribokinase
MLKPIVVVGSINLDMVASADHLPLPGETVIGSHFKTFFGGKGANQAVAVAKLGYPICMVGNVGDDGFGEQLRDALKQAGVETSCVSTVSGSSGIALITTTTSNGENSIVVLPGANGHLRPQSLERAANLLGQAGFLLAQLEVPLETVEFLAEFAERNKIPLMLDPAPARELPKSMLRKVHWLTPNESEAGTLLGSTIDKDEVGIFGAADQLLALGVRNVLLKLGSRGCVIAEGNNKRQLVPAFRVDAVDTTAAGDAFNGAFAVGLLRGHSPVETALFACAVAAISVTRHGAQCSLPTMREVEDFLTKGLPMPSLAGKTLD